MHWIYLSWIIVYRVILKSLLHIRARKGTRCGGKQKRTSVINQFLSLEQCYLLLSLFRNFLLKLNWTYLLYTVKVLLIEFLQHIFFDPSKVTSNPNRRWSLYFSRRIISILNVSFSIVTRSVIGYSCFNNSLYVFLLYSLNIYKMLFKFIINFH